MSIPLISKIKARRGSIAVQRETLAMNVILKVTTWKANLAVANTND